MLHERRLELMNYRLAMADEKLNSAKILLEYKSYKDSISRSYYAMFTAVRAILALDGVDFKKHAGVISYFQREYIKSGIFDKMYSKYLSQAFQVRNNTDYADFFIISQDEAQEQYDRAVDFCCRIKKYLKGRTAPLIEQLSKN